MSQHPFGRSSRPSPRGPFLALTICLLFGPGTLRAADKFKPFSLKTPDGSTKTLRDMAGTATLVGFFFPSCVYCNAAVPSLQNIYDKYKGQGLSVVWINIVPGENKKIAAWLAKHQFGIPVLIGASQASLQRDYKVKMTPTHYLLDAHGDVVYVHAGYEKGDEVELEQKIQQTLGKP